MTAISFILNFIFTECIFAFGSTLMIIGFMGNTAENEVTRYILSVFLVVWIVIILLSEVLSTFVNHKFVWVLNAILLSDILITVIGRSNDSQVALISIVSTVIILILSNITAYIKRKDEPATWKKQAWNGKTDEL